MLFVILTNRNYSVTNSTNWIMVIQAACRTSPGLWQTLYSITIFVYCNMTDITYKYRIFFLVLSATKTILTT